MITATRPPHDAHTEHRPPGLRREGAHDLALREKRQDNKVNECNVYIYIYIYSISKRNIHMNDISMNKINTRKINKKTTWRSGKI